MNARNVFAPEVHRLFGYLATAIAASFFLAVTFGVI